MTFNEANTVEAFIRDRLAGEAGPAIVSTGLARQGRGISGLGWHFMNSADLPRQPQEALVEPYLREALIRLNPEIAANPSRVDDVLYRLRAIVMGVRSDGLVKSNRAALSMFSPEYGNGLALIDYLCSQFPVMISRRSAMRKDDNSGLVDNSRSCSDSKIHCRDNSAEQQHSYLELEPSAPLLVAGSSVRSMGSCFFMGGGGVSFNTN